MTTDREPSLADQRLLLRGQLQEQRREIAWQLEPASGRFPRSVMMRVLIRRPELVAQMAGVLIGPRFARSLSFALVLMQALREPVRD